MSAPPATDIPSLLGLLASRGDRPALSFYRGKALEGRLSYGELVARVESLAGALHARFGVRSGDRVAILSPNRLEIPVLVLALLRLGAVVVPLNPAASAEDWTYVLRHAGARGLCVTRDLADRLPAVARPAFMLHVEDAFAVVDSAPPAPEELAEQLGVVLYTSGTTGNPKGVALRQRNLLANGWSMARNFRLDATTQLAVLPLYHAHALGFGLMTALTTGGHLVFTERLEPFTWSQVIRTEAVEVSSVVPALLPMLLAAGVTRDKVPSLRHLMVSSAPLAVEVAREFEKRVGVPLIQGWGLSEYTNFACCVSPDETAGGSGSSPDVSRKSSSAMPRSTALCGSSGAWSKRSRSCRDAWSCSAFHTASTARRSAPTSRWKRSTRRWANGSRRQSRRCRCRNGRRWCCTVPSRFLEPIRERSSAGRCSRGSRRGSRIAVRP